MATVLTNDGEEWVAERIAGTQGAGTNNVATNAGTHIGIGTDATAAAKGDTALGTEVETRATTTVTVTGTGSSAKYQATGAAITATGARAVTEAGLFSASTTGVMFISADFSVINLATNDTLAVTFTLDPS
jgi:hypothetical protein